MLNGKIYVTGGFTRRWQEPAGPWRLETLKSLYVYTPSSNPTDPETRDRGLVFDPAISTWSEVAAPPVGGGGASTLARVFVNEQPLLSLVYGTRPNNHYQFIP